MKNLNILLIKHENTIFFDLSGWKSVTIYQQLSHPQTRKKGVKTRPREKCKKNGYVIREKCIFAPSFKKLTTMKKLSKLLLLLLIGTTPFLFSGCNQPTDDEILAMLVDGSWDGKMDISYKLENGMTYNSTSSHVQFWNDLNSTTSGHGKWCNTFPETAPYTSLSYEFTWEAKDKVIYIHFKTDTDEYSEKANVKIGTYYINAGKFTGKISTMDDTKSTDFKFIHTSSPWEWDYYVIYPWDVYPFYPWYDPWYDPFYW